MPGITREAFEKLYKEYPEEKEELRKKKEIVLKSLLSGEISVESLVRQFSEVEEE